MVSLCLLEYGIRCSDNYHRYIALVVCVLPAFIKVPANDMDSYGAEVGLMITSCFAYFAWRIRYQN